MIFRLNLWKTHGQTFDISAKGDKAALLKHYNLCHPLILIEKPELSECFTVTFVEQPSVLRLAQCEDKWAALLGSSINVKKINFSQSINQFFSPSLGLFAFFL